MTSQENQPRRPGGFLITERALLLTKFIPGASILDLGCGTGLTVEYLTQKYRFKIYGLDKNPELEDNKRNILCTSAERIPFPDRSQDGVLMECSFSMMDNPAAVLKECYRVLKPSGCLIISDLYARGESISLKGCLKRVDTKEGLSNLIIREDFGIEHFEDFSEHLMRVFGQMLFEKGAKSFYSEMGTSADILKQVKCGYCLIITRKMEKK